MKDLPPLPSFDDRNGLRGRFQTHRATSSDSPYAIVTKLPTANQEHAASPSPERQTRRMPDTSDTAGWLEDAAGRRRQQTPSRLPGVDSNTTGAPALRPHSRHLDNPWAAEWRAVGYTPPRYAGRTPTPFEEFMSPGYVGSGRTRSRRTVQEDVGGLRAQVGGEGFSPSPGPRTPDGGIREGDNWHSEEAIRDENKGGRTGITKLRKNKSNECRLKGGLDRMADRMSCHH